jgi:hypothetical protein
MRWAQPGLECRITGQIFQFRRENMGFRHTFKGGAAAH